jgi:hypothetical protein
LSEDPSRAAWLRQARSHLRHADPVLARLIDDRPDFDPRAWLAQLPPMDLYGALLFQVTTSPHPPSCWERRPPNSARPACRGARSARFATSPGGYRTGAWTRTC